MDFNNLPLGGNVGNLISPKSVDKVKRNPIKEFVSHVKSGGLARTNRYSVVMDLPFTFNDNVKRKALLFCDQVQLPGTNFSTTQNRTFGEFRDAPYEKLYEDITMSFYVDKDMQVKNLFDLWQEHMYNPQTRTFNYYNNYVTDIRIKVQDVSDKTHYYVTLYECYPKSIGAVQLDYASRDVMKLSVSIAYKWFDATTTAPDGFSTIPKATPQDKLMNFAIGAAGSWAVTQIPSLTSKIPRIRF
jgi:hypothetical protein